MKAIAIYEPGGPEVLRLKEVETSEPPGGREVLIQVKTASANGADTTVRQETTFGTHRGPFQVAPGLDITGTLAVLVEGLDR